MESNDIDETRPTPAESEADLSGQTVPTAINLEDTQADMEVTQLSQVQPEPPQEVPPAPESSGEKERLPALAVVGFPGHPAAGIDRGGQRVCGIQFRHPGTHHPPEHSGRRRGRHAVRPGAAGYGSGQLRARSPAPGICHRPRPQFPQRTGPVGAGADRAAHHRYPHRGAHAYTDPHPRPARPG